MTETKSKITKIGANGVNISLNDRRMKEVEIYTVDILEWTYQVMVEWAR